MFASRKSDNAVTDPERERLHAALKAVTSPGYTWLPAMLKYCKQYDVPVKTDDEEELAFVIYLHATGRFKE